jgi:hypothetical protein
MTAEFASLVLANRDCLAAVSSLQNEQPWLVLATVGVVLPQVIQQGGLAGRSRHGTFFHNWFGHEDERRLHFRPARFGCSFLLAWLENHT